ncbi:MAG: glycosyl hydrolase [Prevotella sp.]|nr:glycosyl hydrolase [Prevotella sp.]
MKTIKYLLTLAFIGGIMVACDTDVENLEIQKPYTYSDLYYQNLRDFKATDHEISFMWFAQWSGQNSMAVRFTGLPDSLDMCSIWGGGIPPKENTQLWEDLRFTQKVKGTKMLYVAIVRLGAEDDSHDFKQVLNEGLAMPAGEAREAKLNEAIQMYAYYYLDQVFENDLDGFDADYEPEGDFLADGYFTTFIKCLAEYMGPNPYQTKEERLKLIQARYGTDCTDVNKILCIDAYSRNPQAECADYINYYLIQNYSGGTPSARAGFPVEKQVFCVNWGDDWPTDGTRLYNQARWKPATGRKGGFGAFYGQRDYFVHEYNPEPYYRFRECIQIQNPAVH